MATKLTEEQKAKFGPMLQRTWMAIADDICSVEDNPKIGLIIEVTCDANRPQTLGGMSKEEYDILCRAYDHRDTKKWLRQLLNY